MLFHTTSILFCAKVPFFTALELKVYLLLFPHNGTRFTSPFVRTSTIFATISSVEIWTTSTGYLVAAIRLILVRKQRDFPLMLFALRFSMVDCTEVVNWPDGAIPLFTPNKSHFQGGEVCNQHNVGLQGVCAVNFISIGFASVRTFWYVFGRLKVLCSAENYTRRCPSLY